MPDKPQMAVVAEDAEETVIPLRRREDVRFLGRFTVLSGAMRELWIIFAIKLLAILAYKTMNMTLVLWLSSSLGYDDKHAGYWIALWSTSITVFTLLVGSLTDAMGLRKAFLLGVWICVVARVVMTFTTVKWIALGCGLMPLAFGEALGSPVMIAAVRRYSTTAQRSIAFSMSYVVMNLGFFIGGFLFDSVRGHLGEYGQFTVPLLGIQLSTYRTLFLISLLFELLLVPIVYFGIREGAEATDEGVRITREDPKYPGENAVKALWLTMLDTLRETGRMLSALASQPGFYRLLGFLMLIAFVKLIFMQMDYVFPKFGIRELGQGAPIGRLWALNSILIIFLVPLIGILSQKMSAYRAVTLGSAISAVSVFIMAFPASSFQALADGRFGYWIAHWYLGVQGAVHPYYVMIVLYVIVLSVGEAFYSPRVYEYAAAIAPRGQEASYGALSYVPFLLAKLLIGTFSGVLLDRYCPESGPRHSQTMWLIVALTATIAPLGLLVLRRYIRVPEAGREE